MDVNFVVTNDTLEPEQKVTLSLSGGRFILTASTGRPTVVLVLRPADLVDIEGAVHALLDLYEEMHGMWNQELLPLDYDIESGPDDDLELDPTFSLTPRDGALQ